ncbi:sialate O-acetylesterase [Streptomyces aculeolatus]
MLGQSNGEGRGAPYGPRLDPPDSRIWMWDWAAGELRTATVPLSSQQTRAGYSPISRIARRHLEAGGPETRVVVLNAAAGGSGLVAQPPAGTWQVGHLGPGPALYDIATAALDAVLAAIRDRYGVTPQTWLYWHQGESDHGTEEADYARALDELCTAVRKHLGDDTVPFAAGGLVPEETPPPRVRRALTGLPSRVEYTAYTDGIANGGDGAGAGLVHYFREAAERLGDAMFDASLRAAVAAADSVPHKPLDVSATYGGGTLVVTWSAPLCRWTDFIVQYALDDGPWLTAHRQVPCEVRETVPGLTGDAARVRVATVNAGVITEFTTAVRALRT